MISKTYGDALFEMAVEENKLDTIREEVEVVMEVLHANEDFVKLMCHPRIGLEEKVSLLEKVFKGRVSDELTGFLVTIESKGRFRDVEAILTYFEGRVREHKRIGVAYVTSAVPLGDSQKKDVENKLLETTNYKSFIMHYNEDSSLIGGMIIRIGDRVVDSSIKTKLGNMGRELSKIQLTNQ